MCSLAFIGRMTWLQTTMSSKIKKRAVLPARPERLSVDQVLEDMASATPDDPVFSILQEPSPGRYLVGDPQYNP